MHLLKTVVNNILLIAVILNVAMTVFASLDPAWTDTQDKEAEDAGFWRLKGLENETLHREVRQSLPRQSSGVNQVKNEVAMTNHSISKVSETVHKYSSSESKPVLETATTSSEEVDETDSDRLTRLVQQVANVVSDALHKSDDKATPTKPPTAVSLQNKSPPLSRIHTTKPPTISPSSPHVSPITEDEPTNADDTKLQENNGRNPPLTETVHKTAENHQISKVVRTKLETVYDPPNK